MSAGDDGHGRALCSEQRKGFSTMKNGLFAAIAIAFWATPCLAQSITCDTFGSMQRCRGPNGYTSTQDTFGSMTRGRDSLGNSWTTDQFGDRTTTRFQPGFQQPRGW
jgi:hypothetical protein